MARRDRWVRDPRSWGLVFCAGVCVSRTLAYRPGLHEPLPAGLKEVAAVLPTWVYGVLWALTTIHLVVIAVTRTPARGLHSWIVGIPLLWGFFWFLAYVGTDPPQPPTQPLNAAILFWFMAGIFAAFVLVEPKAPRRGGS